MIKQMMPIVALGICTVAALAYDSYEDAYETGRSMERNRDFEDAAHVYSAAADLTGNVDAKSRAYLNAGSCMRSARKYTEAMQFYTNVIDLAGVDQNHKGQAHVGIGASLQGQAKYDEAIKVYEDVLSMENVESSLYASALSGIGDCYRQKKMHKEAVDAYGKLLTLEKIAPNLRASTQLRIGACYYDLKEYDNARKAFEAVLAMPDAVPWQRKASQEQLEAIESLSGMAGFSSTSQGDQALEQNSPYLAADRKAFEEVDQTEWSEVFFDPCTGDWTERWFLDGEVGTVSNGEDGMQLSAGPEFGNNAHHVVLWTKDSFEGDLKIEFDYTRLDAEKRCVNILYIQATGSGKPPYATDIIEWIELRRVPAMRLYHTHMNAYHISFSAYPVEDDPSQDYVRARRYMPEESGLKGSDLEPDYLRTGLFETGVPHRFTVIKRGDHLYMRVSSHEKTSYFHWHNDKLPPIDAGRIGLRHMFTRSAIYKNFRVSQPKHGN